MQDRCLNKLDEAWDEAEDWTRRAKLVRSIIIYCRQRYGAVAKFKDLLEPKIALLEDNISEIPADELCAVTSAVAYGRKQISESGEQFGGGFNRQPSDAELGVIHDSIRGGTLRLKTLIGKNFAGPGDNDDFRPGRVDDDSS